MNFFLRILALIVPACLAVTGCVTDPDRDASSSTAPGPDAYQSADLGTLTYRAVDLMLAAAPEVTRTTPLVVASLTDAGTLQSSSALGNIIADMIRSRLAQTGHKTSEVRLRSAMSLKTGSGEFMLSRNRFTLMPSPDAAAIVTGTYAVSYEKAYVSLKLISAVDSHIVAGADFVVPLGDILGLMPDHPT
jgi:FlgO protein